jgi:hypothetical protein
MTAVAVVAAVAVLVTGAVLLVAWPFVAPGGGPPEERLTPADRRRLELAEARDAAYLGLRELEDDVRTGKVTPEDYERERTRLRAEAAAALRGLDALG